MDESLLQKIHALISPGVGSLAFMGNLGGAGAVGNAMRAGSAGDGSIVNDPATLARIGGYTAPPQTPNEQSKGDLYAPVRAEGINRLRTQFGQEDAPAWQNANGWDAQNIASLVPRQASGPDVINQLMNYFHKKD